MGRWCVTGTLGAQHHIGSVTAQDPKQPEKLDRECDANVTKLRFLFDSAPYLTPHSEFVALMELEHQVQTLNLIARTNFESRAATHYDQQMNVGLDRPIDFRSDSTQRRIESAGDQLVDCTLFVDEFELREPVHGTSDFSEEFFLRGPRDSRGRSLREFDLNLRLMKFPCSYLIHSKLFDRLPKEPEEYVFRRLFDILSQKVKSKRYAHLSPRDRRQVLKNNRDTKSDLPDFWKTSR